MNKLFDKVVFGNTAALRATRFVSTALVVFSFVRLIEYFFPHFLPTGVHGIVTFALVVVCLMLSQELVVTHKRIHCSTTIATGDIRNDFANSLIAYATSLSTSTPPRDQALLELRRWSSRLLHLNGSHKARVEIGRLALGAAAAISDRYSEASILIDDMGWGLHALGDSDSARDCLNEGIALIEAMPEEERSRSDVLEMLIKAKRHLVSIQFAVTGDIHRALSATEEIRTLVVTLPEPMKTLHFAQLDHTAAALTHRYLDRSLGRNGQVDPTGALNRVHAEAIARSASAESSFSNLGDIERQLKALRIYVELLRHAPPSPRLHTAESRLARLQAIASRQVS